MMKPVTSLSIKKQRGAILSVAFIMLFLLSILGLAVMRTSTLEEKMAANSLHEDIAFQAAETISEEAISNIDNMTQAFNASSATTSVPFSNPHMEMVEANTTVSYVGEGMPIGFSNDFSSYRFIADSTGTIDEANTSTRITQGFYRVVPAPKDK